MATILCDVDGVVANLMDEWLRLYNKDYNDNLTTKYITDWYVHKFVKAECGEKIYDYLDLPNLYDGVLPIGTSLASIHHLRKVGNRIVYVTTGVHAAKVKWLNDWGFLTPQPDYGGYLYHPDVIVARDKSLIKGDIMIDDRPSNLGQDKFSILFDQPWNRSDSTWVRAHGWLDVLDRIVG